MRDIRLLRNVDLANRQRRFQTPGERIDRGALRCMADCTRRAREEQQRRYWSRTFGRVIAHHVAEQLQLTLVLSTKAPGSQAQEEHGDCRREQDECHAAFVRRRSGSSPTRTSYAYMMHPTQILKPKFSSASAPTIHASTHATPG